MGFDISGINATSKKGEYFRNNVWWWRGLWAFTCHECADLLTDEQKLGGQFNQGTEVSAELSVKIADRLDASIANKRAHKFSKVVADDVKKAKKHNAGKKCGDADYDWSEAYPFSVGNVREFSGFCRDSGGFQIW